MLQKETSMSRTKFKKEDLASVVINFSEEGKVDRVTYLLSRKIRRYVARTLKQALFSSVTFPVVNQLENYFRFPFVRQVDSTIDTDEVWDKAVER